MQVAYRGMNTSPVTPFAEIKTALKICVTGSIRKQSIGEIMPSDNNVHFTDINMECHC